MKRIAVYTRVSTDRQETKAQHHAIQQWLASREPAEALLYFTDSITGKRDDRPGLLALREAVASGLVDTVVVYRLDRLSRNSLTAMRLLLDWIHLGIEFFAVDQAILQLGKDNPLRLTVVALFSEIAQLEHQAIVARVRSGVAAAKARGVKFGRRNKVTTEKAQGILQARQAGQSYRTIAKQFGVSHDTVQRICKEAGNV